MADDELQALEKLVISQNPDLISSLPEFSQLKSYLLGLSIISKDLKSSDFYEILNELNPGSELYDRLQLRQWVKAYDNTSDPEILNEINSAYFGYNFNHLPPKNFNVSENSFISSIFIPDFPELLKAGSDLDLYNSLEDDQKYQVDLENSTDEVFACVLESQELWRFRGIPKRFAEIYNKCEVFTDNDCFYAMTLDQIEEIAEILPKVWKNENFVWSWMTKKYFYRCDSMKDPQKYEYMKLVATEICAYHYLLDHFKFIILGYLLSLEKSLGKCEKLWFLRYLSYYQGQFSLKPASKSTEESLKAFHDIFKANSHTIDHDSILTYYLSTLFFTNPEFLSCVKNTLNSKFLKKLYFDALLLRGEPINTIPKKYLSTELIESVVLEPCEDNPRYFTRTELVRFSMNLKNIQKLYIKVIELNPRNYFLKTWQKISTDININGLVSQNEYTFQYSEPCQKRFRIEFVFPELTENAGLFMIEFFGGNLRNQVIIKKGSLRYVSKANSRGHELYILDEDGKLCTKGAGVYLDMRFYAANEATGLIQLPFGREKIFKKIIITDGVVCELAKDFKHLCEDYTFNAQFIVNEQQMIAGCTTTVLMIPNLALNGVEIPISVFEQFEVMVRTINAEGRTSSIVFKDLKALEAKNVFKLSFEVPYYLKELIFEVNCEGKSLEGDDLKKNFQHKVFVNQALVSSQIINLLLVKHSNDFILQVKGRNGEAIAKQIIKIEAQHYFWMKRCTKSLITDELGQIFLGDLEKISEIYVSVEQENATAKVYSWDIIKFRQKISYPDRIDICLGDKFTLPIIFDSADENTEELFSFILFDESDFAVKHMKSAVSLDKTQSLLRFENLEAGSYYLCLKNSINIWIIVHDGFHFKKNWIITDTSTTYINDNQMTIGISKALQQENKIQLELSGEINANTKVIALYFNYLTSEIFKLPGSLIVKNAFEQSSYLPNCFNIYMPSKILDEDSQYVINRKKMKRFIGSSLPKPQILLKREFIKELKQNFRDDKPKLQLATKAARKGGNYKTPKKHLRGGRRPLANHEHEGFITSFDFLTGPAVILQFPISEPELDLPKLLNFSYVLIIAFNMHQHSYKLLQFDTKIPHKDTRFKTPLINSIETYNSAALTPGNSFTLTNLSTSSIQIIDSLPKLFNLISEISLLDPYPQFLQYWSFLTSWNTLNFEKKKKIYDKFASHELNFFIFKRDYEFFLNVVKPFISCKANKDIPDKYLCGISIIEYSDFTWLERLNYFEMALVIDQLKESNFELAQRMVKYIYEKAEIEKVEVAERVKRIKAALHFDYAGNEKKNLYEISESDEEQNDRHDPVKRKYFGGKLGAKKRHRKILRQCDYDGEEEDPEGFEDNEIIINDKTNQTRDGNTISFASLPKYYKKVGSANVYRETYYSATPKFHATFFAELSNSFLLNQPWLSESVLYSNFSLTEQILILSYSSLPELGQPLSPIINDDIYRLTSESNLLIFYKELTGSLQRPKSSISFSVKYYEHSTSKPFMTEVKQFLKETLYNCKLTIANSSDKDLNLSVLSQIPEGSIACDPCESCKTQFFKLKSCETRSINFSFYFPMSGDFLHYAGNVADNQTIIANCEINTIQVLDMYNSDSLSSFKDFAMAGRKDLIIDFLSNNDILAHECEYDLNSIGWLLKDREFWLKVISIHRHRLQYDKFLWSFAFFHNEKEAVAEILVKSYEIRRVIGCYFTSGILKTEEENISYAEYDPIINSRVTQTGCKQRISNRKLRAAWEKLLVLLAEKGSLDDKDRMQVCQYLIYQDRYSEAIDLYQQIKLKPSEGILEANELQLQFDYLTCYLYPETSQSTAELYKNYPILTWNKYFKAVIELVNNLKPTDSIINAAAHNEPILNFQIISNCIDIVYENLSECLIRIYEIDLETLFSSSPFLIQVTQSFSYVKPNFEIALKLRQNPERVSIENYKGKNLWIEIDYKANNVAKSHFSNLLLINVIERFGIIKVMETNRKPRPAAYIKSYAMLKNGKIEFYKDGYTDIQGKFDYVSLNTDKLDTIKKFALLVVDDELGSLIQEILPPPQ